MGKLTTKEQILLSYYVQYYSNNQPKAMCELHEKLETGMDSVFYNEAMELLTEEELVNGMEKVPLPTDKEAVQKIVEPMITNKGILYIDTVLGIQSYAVEGNKLTYVKNCLLTSNLELTLEAVKAYVKETVGMD